MKQSVRTTAPTITSNLSKAFPKLGSGFALLALLAVSGCGGSGGGSNIARQSTTRSATTSPVPVMPGTPQIPPRDVADYAKYGYSATHVGPGDDQGRKFDLMPAGYKGTGNTARLLTYFTMSDVHITDKESPAEIAIFGWSAPFQAGGLFSQAYSPVMLSTTQVLDATVRTINNFHRTTPLDFGLVLGDIANSSQLNEVRWFIDVMDGKQITPSSGDHLGADTIDYQRPFQAAGLDPSIPWYEVIGNHDQYWMGIGYPTQKIKDAQVGTGILNISSQIFNANATDGTGLYVGVIDGTTELGSVVMGGATANFATPPTVAADPNRISVTADNSSPTRYVSEFFDTTSLPVGHGFDQTNTGSLAACYTFEPKADLPIKVIVLDNTCKTNNPNMTPEFYGGGWVDVARYNWLVSELQKGQDAGQLMILACHIPIRPQKDLFDTAVARGFAAESPHDEDDMIATLHHYPNLILLMAGHRHMNVVTPQPSPDPAHPEFGFWEVETSSLRDFPRNFRVFEIMRNLDNSISIITTDVDPVTEPGSPAAKSVGYSVGAARLFGNIGLGDSSPHVYNAELMKFLTPAMQTKIAGYGTSRAPIASPAKKP